MTTHQAAHVGHVWSFQNYPVPQSRRGTGGWNNDMNSTSRLKGADASTNALVRKAQERERKSDRELKEKHHATDRPQTGETQRAQSTYLFSWLVRGESPQLDLESLALIAGGLAILYIIFK
jgi:hypothetical protein